jgi:hypothetical protein
MRYLGTEGLVESVARKAQELYSSDYSSTVNVGRIRNVIDHLA